MALGERPIMLASFSLLATRMGTIKALLGYNNSIAKTRVSKPTFFYIIIEMLEHSCT